MTHLNDTMSTSLLTTHKKNAHLTKEERVMIATLKSQGLSNRAIGRQLGVNHQTINNELNRGTVRQLRRQKSNGKIYEYSYYTSIVMKLVRPHILNITAILVVVAYIILQSNFYD
ncbi:hypothetical protein A8C50_10090 [Ligilactobacillus salivarius]|uniref:Transposase IS30-like HTH domain-containing protein n=2 Tax=Ligilactobacillus salivarius TaxID=1624 RepID=A0A9X6S3A7_9LACO|nr:helix-turn-helix domain-containing protein [Ligilactobacillus salivarius]CDK35994.1 putative transposase [Ligilactobacillus salivarius cp400]MDH4960857.1 helix-turn-helix domain-containing protein [Ligilactobacillus salivarius]OTF88578.1 hypothetical protein A8C38_10520 [Ligilactobacillus salivarius]PAY25593.1 hypothetical protein A8C33_10185 [Ligilactobacillus salivarius]PAY27206.1 hypothetical protein A8C49_09990 [Ligilactobacillus salivarius]